MAVVALDKPVSLKGVSRRENEFGHGQFLIGELFEMLHSRKEVSAHPAARRAHCVLGITLEDIYPGDEWNFVYGQVRS
jgi:hypothetical protein